MFIDNLAVTPSNKQHFHQKDSIHLLCKRFGAQILQRV